MGEHAPPSPGDDRLTDRVLSLCFQAREEGKALLRQIALVRDQMESSRDGDVFSPLSNNNTPVRRVSPLNLISFTP